MSIVENLTEKEVERDYGPAFNVKRLQTWRYLRRGGPRFLRIGRNIFYPRAEIERFIASRLVETDPVQPASPVSERLIAQGRE